MAHLIAKTFEKLTTLSQNIVLLWAIHLWERDARWAHHVHYKAHLSNNPLKIASTHSAEELLGARKAHQALFYHSLEEDAAYRVKESNAKRLENKYSSDPSKYEHLYNMVQEEVDAKTAKASSSYSIGLLWLTRAMDFLVELFRNLLDHPDWTMSQAFSDSYEKTLKKWHGWLASSNFSVAIKLAPDRKKFMEVIGGSGDINSDIEKLCVFFPPLLQENHKFLASVGLDDMKVS